MPSMQLDLLLAISKGVQTVLANQDSNKAIANSKSINKALVKIRGSKQRLILTIGYNRLVSIVYINITYIG